MQSAKCNLSMGGDSSFYMRRDTDTSLNTFFSGMTRTTTVQGVFSESYFYGSLFKGYFVRELYDPDYSHIVKADTISEIYLPDRNYLLPVKGENLDARMGGGPVYPSPRTATTDSSFVLFHPLLRDQSGANVGGMNIPSMKLYKNGGMIGIYQLSEYLARMSPERIVSLSGSGTYVAQITYDPLTEICNRVLITLGFTVPGTDLNPPQISSHVRIPERVAVAARLPGPRMNKTGAPHVAPRQAMGSPPRVQDLPWRCIR